jgi:hypothetical protein
MIPILLAIGVGGAVAAAVVAAGRANARNEASWREAAARLGWAYHDEVAVDAVPGLERFELFRQGRRRRISRIITSPGGDPHMVLFEYAYTTGGGNSQRRHRQTVLYATSGRLALPSFSVRPQHFAHGIAKAFGYQDIDLDEHPEFSGMYVLRGEDEAAVRELFGAAKAAQFFESRPGVCASGASDVVVLWRARTRHGGEAMAEVVAEGMELIRALGSDPRAT